MDQRAYACTLDLLLAEKRAHGDTADRAAELSGLYKTIQKEIKDAVAETLGYEQFCTATHAVRRLVQQFNELQAAASEIADWNDNDASKDDLDLMPAHLGALMRAMTPSRAAVAKGIENLKGEQ